MWILKYPAQNTLKEPDFQNIGSVVSQHQPYLEVLLSIWAFKQLVTPYIFTSLAARTWISSFCKYPCGFQMHDCRNMIFFLLQSLFWHIKTNHSQLMSCPRKNHVNQALVLGSLNDSSLLGVQLLHLVFHQLGQGISTDTAGRWEQTRFCRMKLYFKLIYFVLTGIMPLLNAHVL